MRKVKIVLYLDGEEYKVVENEVEHKEHAAAILEAAAVQVSDPDDECDLLDYPLPDTLPAVRDALSSDGAPSRWGFPRRPRSR